MIRKNDIERARYFLDESQKILDGIKDPLLIKQKIQLKKIRNQLEIPEEPEFDEIEEDMSIKQEIPEFDTKYYNESYPLFIFSGGRICAEIKFNLLILSEKS
jgi:hypothetical protein